MNTKYIKLIIVLIAFPVLFTGCEVFGLDFQEPYDYDYDEGMPSNKVNKSTLAFIESRSDLLSLLHEAIVYTGLESEYTLPDVTYILPTNTAFNSTTESDKSYFQTHMLSYIDEETGDTITYAPITMTAYPKEQVKEFLLYHIVKGKYTHSNLPAEPTWYPTQAAADTAMINMYILKDRNPNIAFNNFDGHFKSSIKPRTSNLLSDEGSYIHVLDSWLDRPTKSQLNLK